MNTNSLLSLIGQNVFNHAAYPICQGQIENVVKLLEALGWQVERRVDTAEFRLAFLTEGTVTIQFTEETDKMLNPGVVNGNHIGISVKNAVQAAQHIYCWLAEAGLQEDIRIEQWDKQGLKWGIEIPTLGFSMELITTADAFNWQRGAQRDLVDAQRDRDQ